MLIAGDIGGTKTHLALFEEAGATYEFKALKTYHSGDHADLYSIIRDYIAGLPSTIKLSAISLAAAGPIDQGVFRATNLPWIVEVSKMIEFFNIPKVALLNDLEASAYALEILPESSLCTLAKGAIRQANRCVVSPGTGLGEAGLIWDGHRYLSIASEGGHCDFGPTNEIQLELARYLMKRFGHASYERVLSGPGLVNCYQFFIDVKGRAPLSFDGVEPAQAISEKGLSGEDDTCKQALDLFVSALAAEASNCALKFMASGGVYLGGGIPPKILPKLKEKQFLESFISKGRFKSYLENIPVHVILDEKGTLKGAAHYGRLFLSA